MFTVRSRTHNAQRFESTTDRFALQLYSKFNWKYGQIGLLCSLCARTQKRKCLTYWGGDRKKRNGHRKTFQKRSITLKNAWLPPHFMLRDGSGKPIQHVISFWL